MRFRLACHLVDAVVERFPDVRYGWVHKEVYDMVDNESLLKYMIDVKYLTPREAMYDRRYPFCVEPTEWNSFLNFINSYLHVRDKKPILKGP